MIIFPIIYLFLLLILSGIVWLFYWIPKKIGYPRVGKILAEDEDKARLIHDIVSAKDFNPKIQESSIRYSGEEDYYNGPKSIKYYETETQYVKELFEPQGEGYAPIYRKVELDKQANLLIFEDIAE